MQQNSHMTSTDTLVFKQTDLHVIAPYNIDAQECPSLPFAVGSHCSYTTVEYSLY